MCLFPGPCSDPGPVQHASPFGAVPPFQSGDQVIFKCDPGYTGGGVVTCQGDDQWTEIPTCDSGESYPCSILFHVDLLL